MIEFCFDFFISYLSSFKHLFWISISVKRVYVFSITLTVCYYVLFTLNVFVITYFIVLPVFIPKRLKTPFILVSYV